MFNPSFRYQSEEINRQADGIIKSSYLTELLHQVPLTILIINAARQVVYVNKDYLSLAGDKERKQLIGLRAGECFNCVRAVENLGCGSTAYCHFCGFANSINLSEMGKENHQECNLALKDGESLTLSIHTKPFRFEQEDYIFCSIEDISDRKARQMLESIFLHDIQNTSCILSGLQEVYHDMPAEEVRKILNDVSVRIDDEILSYKTITSAENQSLKISPAPMILAELVNESIHSFKLNPRFSQKTIHYFHTGEQIFTDKTLLRQVLINLIKNALEAGPAQDTIEISHNFDPANQSISLQVKNNQIIPEGIQMQLFQKSFSTKGKGRGWGTYSIKLLTEKYLQGKVSMVSNPLQGTIFTITLPTSVRDN